MIGFVAKVAIFAAKAKLRGDLKALSFVRSLIWDAENKLDRFGTAEPMTLPVVDLRELVDDREFPVRIADVQSQEGTIGLYEAVCLAVIARFIEPNVIFEFGTHKGCSTMLFLRHSPATSMVYTLDMDIKEFAGMEVKPDDGDIKYIDKPRIGEQITEQVENGRVKQLLGNSMAYDFAEYENRCDLIFVDAGHSYPFVKSDTDNAFEMLRNDGVIIWHDYKANCPGVVRALHEASRSHEIYQIRGTSLAVCGLSRQEAI